MQPEISTPPTSGETTHHHRGGGRMGSMGTQTPDYLSDVMNTSATWAGQAGDFITHQTRERPLLVSFLFVGILGSIVGARIAQYQAMQRRKNAFEKAMDNIGGIGAFLSGEIFRRPKGPMDVLRDRGQEVLGATRDWSSSISSGMPMVGRARPEFPGGEESMVRQVGYALSLIPVTVAFLRNPLVRNLGFRYLGRRMMGR